MRGRCRAPCAVAAGQPPAPGGGDAVADVRERLGAVPVRVDDDRGTGLGGDPDVHVGQVPAVRVAVDLEEGAGPSGGPADRLHVDRVWPAPFDQPARGVSDRVHKRVLHGPDHPLGLLLLAHPERRVEARHHPVQLGEHVVLVVERAVRQHVHLGAGEDADALGAGVQLVDPLRLAQELVRLDVVPEPVRRGVVGDRDVPVAELPRGRRHLLDRVAAVRGGGVTVELAADVLHADKFRERPVARRLQLAAVLAQLRLDVLEAE